MKFTFTFNFVLALAAAAAGPAAPTLSAAGGPVGTGAVEAAGPAGRPIAGAVVDRTGAALPGAMVSVRVRDYESQVQSDAQGRFAFQASPRGRLR